MQLAQQPGCHFVFRALVKVLDQQLSSLRVYWWRVLKGCVLLAVSAALVGVAASGAGWAWTGWIALAPLLIILSQTTPAIGFFAGAWWGAIAVLCCAPAAHDLGAMLIVALTVGVYGALVSAVTKRIGFSPLVVAILWIGVELVLAPVGFDQGLVAATQSSSAPLAWLNSIFGYAIVAFGIVWINAHLALALHRAIRRSTKRPGLLPPTILVRRWRSLNVVCVRSLRELCEGGARAPPSGRVRAFHLA